MVGCILVPLCIICLATRVMAIGASVELLAAQMIYHAEGVSVGCADVACAAA